MVLSTLGDPYMRPCVLYGPDGNALWPSAAVLADATANPTTSLLAALGAVFNGTTWDRQRDGSGDTVIGSVKAMLMLRNAVRVASGADLADAVSGQQVVATAPTLYSTAGGGTFDRQRNNSDTAALITAAGATSNQTGTDQINYNARGLIVVFDMTTVGTGSVTLTIQGKDAASGKYYTLLASAAIVTNVTNVYTVYPGCIAAANSVANLPLPRTWRVITTANNANATTYTVGASVIL